MAVTAGFHGFESSPEMVSIRSETFSDSFSDPFVFQGPAGVYTNSQANTSICSTSKSDTFHKQTEGSGPNLTFSESQDFPEDGSSCHPPIILPSSNHPPMHYRPSLVLATARKQR